MGTPAIEHSETTALETAESRLAGYVMSGEGLDIQIWSAMLQDCWTQGPTVATSPGFAQWQAKSVRDEQPSLVKAETKQLSWIVC